MNKLPIVSLSSVSLPPIPSSSSDPFHFFWHPEEKAFWLLVLGKNSSGDVERRVWRVSEDGTGAIVLSDEQLGLPDDLDADSLRAFYFDTARGQPVWLVSTSDEVVLGAFDGKTFVKVKQKKTIRASANDSFVFDPARRVLVHFVSQEKMEREGLSVRELGSDGEWQDKGAVMADAGSWKTFAAWDERQKLAVVVDSANNKAFGWDGKNWRELPEAPFSNSKAATTHPRTKGLVLIEESSGYTASYKRYRSAELTDTKWVDGEESALKPLERLVSIAYIPERNESYVYAPKLGGTIQHTLGRYDGQKVHPAGQPVLAMTGGSTAGPVLFWSYDGMFSVVGEELRKTADHPEEAVLGFRADRTGCVAVGRTGEVERLTSKGWTSVCKAPPGFTERCDSSMGSDGTGRLLVVGGGDPYGGKKFLTDTWLFDGKTWTQLTTRGPGPKTLFTRIAFEPSRSTWVVIGGRKKDAYSDHLDETHELDGNNKWVAFKSNFDESPGLGARFIARDDASGQLFLVTYGCNDPDRLHVYRGAGEWHCVGDIDAALVPWGSRSGIDAPYAYDDERRVLVGYGRGSLVEVAIGAALDAVRPKESAQPKASESEAKPRPRDGAKTKGKEQLTEEAIPPAVWLRLQEDGSEKFWFASSREGATWTACWGRRGATPSEKVYTLDSRAAAKSAYEKAVREKLKKGYEHAPEKEAAALVPGRMSYRFKLGKFERIEDDMFGGIPAGVTRESWPICAGCNHPMPHVMTLHAHPERLPLTKHAAITLFVCDNESSGGTCLTSETDKGCNAALLLTAAELERAPLSTPPSGKKGAEPSKTMRARKLTYREVFEADPEKNENVDDIEVADKVGGYPGWYQFENTPKCDKCRKEMRFVAQLQEEHMTGGGSSEGYLFCCLDEHQAKFFWQH
ncbi:WGR domain-containing protein [Polyangium jinanense]|uniref:WGR domain-containing protein n=1 Tax=Polyangium jinanense TaxID=2829994 RepID=A0A9X4AX69_9BACT|nr:WGR domain-containing protein [Polyangium jinanense]MDC3958181.1 WGR domain-containing protein [Polyangium jinanense]MDC3988133.1 WGR domain-containing protein [Polyangium jinanense]